MSSAVFHDSASFNVLHAFSVWFRTFFSSVSILYFLRIFLIHRFQPAFCLLCFLWCFSYFIWYTCSQFIYFFVSLVPGVRPALCISASVLPRGMFFFQCSFSFLVPIVFSKYSDCSSDFYYVTSFTNLIDWLF